MPRAIWRGAISFGMVSIPVKLYTATESKDVSFRQLHRDDLARIRQLRWCPVEDREVAYDELVKGYEYAKDQYVVMDDEDFEDLPVPSKHTINLTAFVKAEEIDPIYYDRPYFLDPDEAGVKPFALLLKALEEKDLVAIGKVAIRNKENLCALRTSDGGIVMETLLWPDEIRPAEVADVSEVKVSAQELKMAFSLIEMLEESFNPKQYTDEYREALLARITAKLEGGEVVHDETVAPSAQPVDLMAALKASIEATKSRKGPAEEAKAEAAGDGNGAEEGEAPKKKPARSRKKAKAGSSS